MGLKSKIVGFFSVTGIMVALTLGGQIVETVEKGTYQIKQAAVTGDMSAHMNPGMYAQMFGDIQTWPKSETFYFTSDGVEGSTVDTSIGVMFADGSKTAISGTLRILYPTSPTDAINLVTTHGYRSASDLEGKLILPILRKALINTANMMTARESYAEKKNQYFIWAWDQIENGMYITEETERQVIDPTDPEGKKKIWIKARAPKLDKDGQYIREANHPLKGTGVTLANFEVKNFDYPDLVDGQIKQQQENFMAIATAKSNAQKAKQDAITAEELGKAEVKKAQYENEVIKIKAVVEAQKVKEVAELKAEQGLEVARFDKQAAAETKQKLILLGQGESERKKLVMEADGALAQKLDAYRVVNQNYAIAIKDYTGDWVPRVIMGGGKEGGPSVNGAQTLIDLLTTKTAYDLGLDMDIKSSNAQNKMGSNPRRANRNASNSGPQG